MPENVGPRSLDLVSSGKILSGAVKIGEMACTRLWPQGHSPVTSGD